MEQSRSNRVEVRSRERPTGPFKQINHILRAAEVQVYRDERVSKLETGIKRMT